MSSLPVPGWTFVDLLSVETSLYHQADVVHLAEGEKMTALPDMDEYLDSQGYFRKQIAKDGSCLFRAVSEHVFYTQAYHDKVRTVCINFLMRRKELFSAFIEGPFDDYIERLKNPKEWAGQVEMAAMSLMYKKDFIVFYEVNKLPVQVTNNNFPHCIMLCYSQNNHYDCVYPKKFLESTAVSQSIVYETLYKDVFKLGDEVANAVKMMLHDKTYSKQRKNNLNRLQRSLSTLRNEINSEPDVDNQEDGETEIRRALSLGMPPFPYKVAKALDPEIYRNVEYDLWNEARKEQIRSDHLVWPELGPGVKCLVRLDESQVRPFCGHVQELTSPEGPVTVFIEDIGEKRTVPYDSLEPLPIPLYKALMCTSRSTVKYSGSIDELALKTSSFSEKFKYKKKMFTKKTTRVQGVQFLFPRFREPVPVKVFGPPTFSSNVDSNVSNETFASKWPNSNKYSLEKQNMKNEVGKSSSREIGRSTSENTGENCSPTSHENIFPATEAFFYAVPNQTQGYALFEDEGKMGSKYKKGSNSYKMQDNRALPEVQIPFPAATSTDGIVYSTMVDAVSATSVTSSASVPFGGPVSAMAYPPPPLLTLQNAASVQSNAPQSSTSNGYGQASNYMVPQVAYAHGVVCPSFYSDGSVYASPVSVAPFRSQDPTGTDLPFADLPTIRFFYNLGCDYFRLSSTYYPATLHPAYQAWNGSSGGVVVPYAGASPPPVQAVATEITMDGQDGYQNSGTVGGYQPINSMVPAVPPPSPPQMLANSGTPVFFGGPQYAQTLYIPQPVTPAATTYLASNAPGAAQK